MRLRLLRRHALGLGFLMVFCPTARSQIPTLPPIPDAPTAAGPLALDSAGMSRAEKTNILLAVALTLAIAEDRHLDELVRGSRNRRLDHLAAEIDPLGRARYVVPALAASYLTSVIVRKPTIARTILRIGIAYVSADVTESALKPLVGRHRPDSTERPFLFHSFSNDEKWHSLPSAHTTHAFAIAEAVSQETSSPWIRGALFTVAGLVGAQRVYLRAHWASDVIASAALSVAASRAASKFACRYIRQ